jgi:colanic acid biosynthesis glycosyl transferase WcaI
MKILLTHRFFWPDTAPYALILRAVGDALAKAGHEVHVLSSMPSYRSETPPMNTPAREMLGALHVRRISVFGDRNRNPLSRLANVVLYCWALFTTILRLRPDVVTASTFPPVAGAWSASLAAQMVGAKFVYHVQDIHPELSQFIGDRLGRGLPRRLLRWLDNQTLQRADVIITLSEDMAKTLRGRGLRRLPITVIKNPPLQAESEIVAPPAELVKPVGTVRVIFAGNIGRFQNLQLLAEGVAQCFHAHPELELMFLGDGVALPELRARWGAHPQVRFAAFLPFAQAQGLIAEADVGLVSLSPNIYKVAYPSKIVTYHKLGLRILALVEPESQLARDLENSGEGIVPAAATPSAIAQALERLIAAPMLTPSSGYNQRSSVTWNAIIDALGGSCE